MQSYTLFPLTLALSLREREQILTVWEYSLNSEHFPPQRIVLPLLEGESCGEGEGRSRLNSCGSAMNAHPPLILRSSAK
jgi:hypothetical protein